jgi:uncharacterized membrane protein
MRQTNQSVFFTVGPISGWAGSIAEVDMLEKFKSGMDDMALAIIIWLCTLPLVGLLVVPFFGLKVGLFVAAALFIAAMVICWGICGWKVFRE